MATKLYTKPTLKKYGHLRSITFSRDEITDVEVVSDYYAKYTTVHTDDKGRQSTSKKVGYV